MKVAVHATHEAGVKVGGIGAVLDGLLGSAAYNAQVERTILLGVYDANDAVEQERLRAPRNGFVVRYHTSEGISHVEPELAHRLHEVQSHFGVSLLYGTRRFGTATHEVLLVDGGSAYPGPVDELKGHLYAAYGIHSERYDGSSEYQWMMKQAPAAVAALAALLGDAETDPSVFIAHEWLGLPALFAAGLWMHGRFRTVFYAHETATVRALVEGNPGHDLRFYNVMRLARAQGLSLESVFGEQRGYFKHALLKAALHLDGLFAVGDLVREELLFLEPSLGPDRVDLVYNGVPSERISLADKARSSALLRDYSHSLHGYRPDWLFSHVTRLVESKGIWRDFRVMEQLDGRLAERGETAIFFLLATVLPTGRHPSDVHRWEGWYGWPLHHRADTGDLVAYEWDYWQMVERFNQHARASRIVFINQFGWSRDRCGSRMPAEMEFRDLRYGSDLEFGQSIYEPFGIAQVEPLAFGALCVVSSGCGCLGFVRDAGGLDAPNVVKADYLYLPEWASSDLRGALAIDRHLRNLIEHDVAGRVAQQIIERLPRDDAAREALLARGYDLSTRMSWEVVAQEYLKPALQRLSGR